MTIVAAGGGSGGHVTPVLAVLHELKQHDPDLKAYFMTDRKFAPQARDILAKSECELECKQIFAGKLRRYHTVSIWRQLLDIPTVAKNIRDVALVGMGFVQSWLYLRKIRPDVVFTKGGFVCLPIGLAAKALKIPLVIHDSDAHAGLTNRLLAKYAAVIATGAPLEFYDYPPGRTHYVGIPVRSTYHPMNPEERKECKAALGLPDLNKPLLVVTGGGLGARNLNRAVVSMAPSLLDKMAILHVTGSSNYEEVMAQAPDHADYIIKSFLPEGQAIAFGAADVVVTRAGATTMLELAAMAKPVIVVPSPYLAGGHQLKNAMVYEEADAAIIVQEEDIILDHRVLVKAILGLCKDPQRRKNIAKNLYAMSRPEAAIDMAALIVEAASVHTQQKEVRQ